MYDVTLAWCNSFIYLLQERHITIITTMKNERVRSIYFLLRNIETERIGTKQVSGLGQQIQFSAL